MYPSNIKGAKTGFGKLVSKVFTQGKYFLNTSFYRQSSKMFFLSKFNHLSLMACLRFKLNCNVNSRMFDMYDCFFII